MSARMPVTDFRSSESRVPLSAVALSKSAGGNMAQKQDHLVTGLNHVKIDDRSSYTVVDTPAKIVNLVDALADLPVMPPSLYVDLEGVNLCRHGSISTIQIYVLPNDHTYLVDVQSLGEAAFSTRSHGKRTLREIMEPSAVSKVFFDVRNDSDALYSHFEVGLNGVHDLQLMELATRCPPRGYVSSLQNPVGLHPDGLAASLDRPLALAGDLLHGAVGMAGQVAVAHRIFYYGRTDEKHGIGPSPRQP